MSLTEYKTSALLDTIPSWRQIG